MPPKKETYCSRVKQSWHSISRMYNTIGTQHDLTTTIGFILLHIDNEEGIPSTSIGPALGMEATSLVRTLHQMEQRGLIARKKNKSDARKVMIQLTNKGKQKREISKKVVKAFNEEVEKKIGTSKLKIFNEVIEKINSIAEKRK
ncbi:MAG: winged helix-turn-helix transcriptional regulator [Bacteroidetes bacterium]|nr:winged helix-turn-helix transcriptional regulator [Bacteroidota bacterium]